MAISFDDEPLEITCPKCGKKIKKTVRWFKADGRKCPFCGLSFETTKFRRDMKEAEKLAEDALRDISKSISRIKIKFKL
jgi:peptide subunit release factor 1 (eRF1)